MNAFAAAEAAFGSISRGDNDALSDRDILIVDTDINLLKQRQTALEFSGWSVASYTFAKLDALIQKGSLFIQHIKDEAEIHRDEGGMLRSRLDYFQPKSSYRKEIMENTQLANLTSSWPKSARGALWAADVLYVATRNFGILHLAQKKRYLFSYSKLLKALADDGDIDVEAVPDLLKLRLAKSLYRSGEYVASDTVSDIVLRTIEVLPEQFFPKQSIAVTPVQILSEASTLPRKAPAYHRLRSLERIYVALLALKPDSVPKELEALSQWIENPRAYAFFSTTHEHDLIDQMQSAARALFPTFNASRERARFKIRALGSKEEAATTVLA